MSASADSLPATPAAGAAPAGQKRAPGGTASDGTAPSGTASDGTAGDSVPVDAAGNAPDAGGSSAVATNDAASKPLRSRDYLAAEPKLTTDPKQVVTYELLTRPPEVTAIS